MTRLVKMMIVVMFATLILAISGEKRVLHKRSEVRDLGWDQFLDWFCQNNPVADWNTICSSTTTSAPVSTSTEATILHTTEEPEEEETTEDFTTSTSANVVTTSSSSPSPLETAHWCQFKNGSYISLGYTFMYNECALCQCTQSRSIVCTNLQCMPTYCIDGTTPAVRPGQCCSQCAYENSSTACVVNGVSFPHGTILRRTSDNVQCWCQLGGIECRKASSTLFSSLDLWGSGTAIYVIIIVICIVLIFGTLLCCASTFVFYYYYKRQQEQQTAQQAYAQYYDTAGWQPMPEDGSAAEKQAEADAEQYQYEYPTGDSQQYIPPPYALYNGSYVEGQGEQTQKQA